MTSIDNMAAEIMKGLTEYADLANEKLRLLSRKRYLPMHQRTPVLMRKAGQLKDKGKQPFS